MSLQKVEASVQTRARKESDAILAEAEQQNNAAVETGGARLREAHERRVAALKVELEGKCERETSAIESANRLKVLGIKNDLLDDIFQQAAQVVVNLPDDGYRAWLRAQIQRLPEDFAGALAGCARDAETLGALIRDNGHNLTLDEKPIEIAGGFMAQSDSVDLDFTLESCLAEVRERMTRDVAAELFSEAEESE